MPTPPPLPANHIQIADDAVNRVPSVGAGAYEHHQRWEKTGLSRHSTQEKDIEEDDERDVRKKQVRYLCLVFVFNTCH